MTRHDDITVDRVAAAAAGLFGMVRSAVPRYGSGGFTADDEAAARAHADAEAFRVA